MLKSLARLLLIGFVLVVFSLGVSRVFAWDVDGEIHHLARWVLHEMSRSDALHQRRIEVAEAMEMKTDAATEFILGSLTLLEAGKQFRAADALVQNHSDGLVAPYLSAKTDQEVYQQVEIRVELSLAEGYTSQEIEEARCRLHDELSELFPATRQHLVD